jgi:ATP phosphoribosyltransferase
MKNKPIVKFALPVGSLNNVQRGNTGELLADSGFDIIGYEPNNEVNKPKFENDSWIEAFVDRPQNMPYALSQGIYDLAIFGSDWAKELQLAGVNNVKVSDLDYGRVKIVVATRADSPIKSLKELVNSSRPVRIRTEYINIAKDAVKKACQPDVGIFTTAYRDAPARVMIEQSYGRTEVGMLNSSSVDAIVEATQTGSSLRKAGLKPIEKIFSSSAGLYASAMAMNRPQRKKIEEIADLLHGAVRSRSFEYVTFNVEEQNLPSIGAYLKEKKYVAKRPTVSIYDGNAVVSTLLPKRNYPLIIAELLQLGADDIVRLPARQIVSRGNGRT